MKLTKRAVAALTAGAALLAIPAAAEPAHASTYAGTVHWGWTTGIPKAVHRGQTITITLWAKQTSPYVMDAGIDTINLYNPKGVNKWGASAPGVTVTWQDPFTKRWMPTYQSFNKGSQDIFLPSKSMKITSGVWSHITARITFSKTVQLGTWHLMGIAPSSWTMLTKTGAFIDAKLKDTGIYVQPITIVR